MRLLSAWKSHLKNFLAFVLYHTGIVCLLDAILLRNRCVVLAYHRVCEAKEGWVPVEEGMSVSPKTFEDHLKYLRKKYRFLSLETFLSSLSSGEPLQKSCLITFDDGWLDTYRNAFPLLRKYDVPATVFLSTSYIGTDDWFWPEKVSYLLSKFDDQKWQSFRTEETRQAARIYCYAMDRTEGIHKAIEYLKQFDDPKIQDILSDLMCASGTDRFPQVRAMLNWAEVADMAHWGISFGSHTKSHLILTRVQDPHKVWKELRESKQSITDHTGRETAAFCFPNGDYDDTLIESVRTCGYKAAFIGARGLVTARDDPYRLKRITVHEAAA
ncbi:MAG: polysaccharide deacetylase family protein, partial [candidate division WOR-3 bacterium]